MYDTFEKSAKNYDFSDVCEQGVSKSIRGGVEFMAKLLGLGLRSDWYKRCDFLMVYVSETNRLVVIAIALSQLSVTISKLLMQHLFHSKFLQTHKDQKWTSAFDNSVRQLRALALEIDAAIEFPILAAIHPMIVAGTFKDASQVPEKTALVAQTLLFLVLDFGIQRHIQESITIAMGRDEASRLAVDILHPRVVLFSTIFLVQALAWFGKGNGFGTLHFVSIWLWLLVRRIFV
ncbi:hypothetical protein B0J14DRAFT_569143 [Halenospora varia]|nr:hypothetical protein B0J14DRAFT_569143 [Halenospora varia]